MTSNQPSKGSKLAIIGPIVLLVVAGAVAVLLATGGKPVTALLAAAYTPTATAAWPAAPATSTARPTRTPTITAGPSPSATFTPRPTPITDIVAIRKLGRLETTQYVMQTVVDIAAERDSLWERIFGTDKLLLIATGEAVAGFDLDKIAPTDLAVDGQSVVLTLPPPEVFSYYIDEGETYVYQRVTGIFIPLDKQLETRARQLAVERLREWALQHDILGKAEATGIARIEALLRSLGFTSVKILVRPAASDQ